MNLDENLILHHKKAEQLFCAATFISPDLAKEECGWLKPDSFIDTSLKKYWADVLGGSVPSEAAINAGIYSQIMGWTSEVLSTDLPVFAKTITDDHFLLETASKLTLMAKYIAERKADELRNTIKELQATMIDPSSEAKTAIDVGLEFNESLYDKPDVVKLGLGGLDNAMGGLDKQTLTILCGRPSMGKSTLAFQIARNIVSQKKRVVFFALEQARKMLWRKISCGMMKYDFRKIKLGLATQPELEKLGKISADLMAQYEDRLLIDDRSRLTTQQIWSVVARYRPDLFIVDHLGYLHDKEESIVQRLGKITREGKEIAKELNCCAIYLSQLNRGVEGRDNKRPTLSDLRDSGELEQNADVVIGIYRDDYYNNKDKPITDKSETELEVLKNRDGVAGVRVKMDFLPIAQFFYPRGETE